MFDLEKYEKPIINTYNILRGGLNSVFSTTDLAIPHQYICGIASDSLGYLINKNEGINNIFLVSSIGFNFAKYSGINVFEHSFLSFTYNSKEYIADPTHLQFFSGFNQEKAYNNPKILVCETSKILNTLEDLILEFTLDIEQLNYNPQEFFTSCQEIFDYKIPKKNIKYKIKKFNPNKVFTSLKFKKEAKKYLKNLDQK